MHSPTSIKASLVPPVPPPPIRTLGVHSTPTPQQYMQYTRKQLSHSYLTAVYAVYAIHAVRAVHVAQVWQGTVLRRAFSNFRSETVRSGAAARQLLEDAGVAHYWDAAAGATEGQSVPYNI